MIVAAATLALAGCSKKPPANLPPPPTSQDSQTETSQYNNRPDSQAAFLAEMGGRETIYFDTDRFNIDNADAAALAAQVQWLMKYPQKRIKIEGHADERGTRDYNLALGERRANATKNYLVGLGIDASRISTMSFGKERPAAIGSDQSAWSLNRRAVTITID
ncbi:peptidoglycan-associated lipoprotein Pal [Altererythrobacter sediminis]|uniref:Peptidoglycan-associated protein n=1 Tax=Allopontixanthobacter sediminis TaxID=1689985 RepID=A0A845B3J2_9SPHN|nr:peptidoglycan-associated lipoprotein Pal [Allopontixanthobacter sediminis]